MGLERKITEGRLQQEIFKWHWNNIPNERGLLFMVHNSAGSRIQGARLRTLGMVKGVSDMVYLKPGGRPIFMELKTPNGEQSESQVKWEKLIKTHGYRYEIARTLEEAKEICGW